MKLRNELQTVPVEARSDLGVEGVVRVRGLDVRVRGRGFAYETQTPLGVVVHTRAGVQRLSLPRDNALPGAAIALAGPLLFLATKRMFRKGR
ncbi:MAG TPA: hypothetical protein VFH62_00150 [Dehalococcoidia bacterium]|jgi:hypothetical protein|nr:hypothetical protein [Dehalococcoidia bacterium]